jgi:hypothetical protein
MRYPPGRLLVHDAHRLHAIEIKFPHIAVKVYRNLARLVGVLSVKSERESRPRSDSP